MCSSDLPVTHVTHACFVFQLTSFREKLAPSWKFSTPTQTGGFLIEKVQQSHHEPYFRMILAYESDFSRLAIPVEGGKVACLFCFEGLSSRVVTRGSCAGRSAGELDL